MAFSYVATRVDAQGNGSGTGTLTVSGASANNLLVAGVCVIQSTGLPAPTGWTQISAYTSLSTGASAALYYRLATGDSNDNFSTTFGTSTWYGASIVEYSGNATSSVLEQSNENETNVSTTGGSTTTGSITPDTAGGAVAFLGAYFSVNALNDSNISINSSFTKRVTSGTESAYRSSTSIADLDLTGTSALNPTWSSSADWRGAYGAIACFAEAGGGGPTYTLTAGTGSYTSTVNTAGLLASRKLTASVTSYTSTVNDVSLKATRKLTASATSYTSSVSDVSLLASRILTAGVGSYTSTVSDATLTYTAGYAPLTAETVSYTSTVNTAGLIVSRLLSAGVATYASTVNDANLVYGKTLAAETASYTSTFNAADLIVSRKLSAETAGYTSTINDATLTYNGAVVLTVTCTLVTRDGTALPNLSALSWAWFDSVDPNSFGAPSDQGETESTDGSGEIVVDLPNTTLTAGQYGTLVLRSDDGSLLGAYNMAAA